MSVEYNVVLAGNIDVGKTTLFHYVDKKKFIQNLSSVKAKDELTKEFTVKDKSGVKRKVMIHLWDTAGAERFNSLTANYFRNISAVVYVFSIDSEAALLALSEIEKKVKGYDPDEKVMRVVIGSKADLKREFNADEAKNFCKSIKCPFNGPLLMSSKEKGKGVLEGFQQIAEELAKRTPSDTDTVKLDETTDEGKLRGFFRRLCT